MTQDNLQSSSENKLKPEANQPSLERESVEQGGELKRREEAVPAVETRENDFVQKTATPRPLEETNQPTAGSTAGQPQSGKMEKIIPIRKPEDLKKLSPDFQVQALLNLAFKENVSKALEFLKRAHTNGYVMDQTHDELVNKFAELEKEGRI